MGKRTVVFLITGVFLAMCLFSLIYLERYRNAIDWIEEGGFSKATAYLDEFPFITELHDPGLVAYAYAGEAMEYGHYEEAILLLQPLADANYRDSVQMLEHCMERVNQTAD